MIYYNIESYFRPEPVKKSSTTTPSHLFNKYRLLLMKAKAGCVFVPIRNLQYQAVLTEDEVIFIDSQGGYALDRHGEGGRLIDLAWHWESQSRDSLSAPVTLQLTFYRHKLDDIQRQLLSSFPAALQAKLDSFDRDNGEPEHCRILPFRAPDSSS